MSDRPHLYRPTHSRRPTLTTPRPRPATVTARIEDTPDTTPVDFFVPGARYYDGDPYKAPEQAHTFQCDTMPPTPGPALARAPSASCAATPPAPTSTPPL
ncbi:hypothetical protein [Streptomyces sp. NPDC055140]